MKQFTVIFSIFALNQAFAQTTYTSLQDAFRNAKSPERLVLVDAKDEEIKKIGTLKNLKELEITASSLTVLPKSIKNLVKLEILNLSGNQLSVLPKEFAQLRSLKSINLSSNKFSLLLPEISLFNQLEELNLSDNQLTDLPAEFENLNKLERLYLKGNNFENGAPAVLAKMSSVKTLHISIQANSSRAVNLIAQMPSLSELKLFCNYNTESLPLEITKLKKLETITISTPPHVFNWEKSMTFLSLIPSLKTLVLSDNNLKTLDKSIEKLYLNLENIDLQNNQLTQLPEGFFSLKNLKRVNLSGNPLTEQAIEKIKNNFPFVEIKF